MKRIIAAATAALLVIASACKHEDRNSPSREVAGIAGGTSGGVAGGVVGGTIGGYAPSLASKVVADVEAIAPRPEYGRVDEHEFIAAKEQPVTTFAIDVDRASYANVRRFIAKGRKAGKCVMPGPRCWMFYCGTFSNRCRRGWSRNGLLSRISHWSLSAVTGAAS